MKIVLLDGAFANQITQYIFARCLEIATGETVYLDDLWFYFPHGDVCDRFRDTDHHEYQLVKFPNAKPHLMSHYFDVDVWNEIVGMARTRQPLIGGSHLPEILKESGMDFTMIAECLTFKSVYHGSYVALPYYYHMPNLLNSQGDFYYWGYFTNKGWYESQKETLKRELWLPEPHHEDDVRMAEDIEKSYSVGIHIRRGGYAYFGNAHPPEYYKQVIRKVHGDLRKERLCFYVFSDEIDYCKEHAAEYGLDMPKRVVYCKSNRTVLDNHVDMQLMSKCKGLILCNSVYGFMAHLLSQREGQWVIDPHRTRNVTVQ